MGALIDAFVWRLTSVCLCVAYIEPKSRTERLRKTKIGGDSPRHTWLGHHFQGQKVEGQGHQAALLSATLTRKAAAAVSVGTYSAWESTVTLRLLGGARGAWAPTGRGEMRGALCVPTRRACYFGLGLGFGLVGSGLVLSLDLKNLVLLHHWPSLAVVLLWNIWQRYFRVIASNVFLYLILGLTSCTGTLLRVLIIFSTFTPCCLPFYDACAVLYIMARLCCYLLVGASCPYPRCLCRILIWYFLMSDIDYISSIHDISVIFCITVGAANATAEYFCVACCLCLCYDRQEGPYIVVTIPTQIFLTISQRRQISVPLWDIKLIAFARTIFLWIKSHQYLACHCIEVKWRNVGSNSVGLWDEVP